jgi:hypothetical protein
MNAPDTNAALKAEGPGLRCNRRVICGRHLSAGGTH